MATVVNSGKLKLERIWLQDKLWYDVSSKASPQALANSRAREQFFTFYDGSLDQPQDPTMVSFLGANRVSGLSGISHIVFKNLPGKDFGGNFPTVKVQVVSDIPATLRDVTTDIMLRSGVQSNRMLIIDRDWHYWRIIEDWVYNALPEGLTLVAENLRQELVNTFQIFRAAFVKYDRPRTINYETDYDRFLPRRTFPEPSVMLVPVTGYTDSSLTPIIVGAETREQRLPEEVYNVQDDITNYPSSLELGFYQTRLDGQRETVRAERASAGAGEVRQLNVEYIWTDRGQPSNIAVWLLRYGWRVVQQYLQRTPSPAMPMQRDIFKLQENRDVELTPTKVVLGADGRSEVYASDVSSILTDATYTPNPSSGESLISASSSPEAAIMWFDGPNVPVTNNRSVAVLIAPATTGASSLGSTASLVYSTDNGVTFSALGSGYNSNALRVVGVVSNFSVANVADFTVVDYRTKISVTVPSGIQLQTIAPNQLFNRTSNTIYMPGIGLVAYEKASLTGVNTYELTGFLWDVAGTAFDYERIQGNGSYTIWLITDALITPTVPPSVTSGATLTLGVTTDTPTINRLSRVYTQTSVAPRPIIDKLARLQVNGDIIASWGLGTTQVLPTLADVFVEEAEDPLATGSYDIFVYNATTGALVRSVLNLSGLSYNYTAALRATDGLSVQNVRFLVARLGVVATNTPTPASIQWFGVQ